MGRRRRACLAWSATIASSHADGVPRSASNCGPLRQARASASWTTSSRSPSGASRAARRAMAGRCGRTQSAKPSAVSGAPAAPFETAVTMSTSPVRRVTAVRLGAGRPIGDAHGQSGSSVVTGRGGYSLASRRVRDPSGSGTRTRPIKCATARVPPHGATHLWPGPSRSGSSAVRGGRSSGRPPPR